MKYTISALVEIKTGVLTRSAALFARRGFNIDSLAVSETESPQVSRMTLTVTGDDRVLEQICHQLEKLVDVIKVLDHTRDVIVERELCLIKVKVNRRTRHEVVQIANIFRGEVVDVGPGNLIIELTGDTEKIDAFAQLMAEHGIEELVRTGKIVLVRGMQPT
ncbi:MAG: acetolactate synthase small subunit [candidate division WS1 bacterium]|nr:acetolactate synthase small subunit [candidate division WS1 bacterium]